MDEQRLAQERILHQEGVLRANKLSDERVETKRRIRMTREMQRELDMAERLEEVRASLVLAGLATDIQSYRYM